MSLQPPPRLPRAAAGLAFALILFAPLSCTKKETLPRLTPPKVSKLKGVVKYLDGGSNWTPIRVGQELPAGTQLIAKRRGWAVIDLPDGTQLRIDRKARVTIAAHSRENVEFRIDVGRIRAWVQKLEKQQFSVRTPNAVCSIRGTRFQVVVTPKGTAVFDLFEGKIHIAHNRGGEIVLEPGQRILATASRLRKPFAIPKKAKMGRLPPADTSGKALRPRLPVRGVDGGRVDEVEAPEEMPRAAPIDGVEAPDALNEDHVPTADGISVTRPKHRLKKKDLLKYKEEKGEEPLRAPSPY